MHWVLHIRAYVCLFALGFVVCCLYVCVCVCVFVVILSVLILFLYCSFVGGIVSCLFLFD